MIAVLYHTGKMLTCLQLERILLCQWSGALGKHGEFQKVV